MNVKKDKGFDYRHCICIAITLGFVACTIFLFFNAFGRIIESFRDLGLSVAYYFCELFGAEHKIVPTVNNYPKVPFFDFEPFSGLSGFSGSALRFPETWAGFRADWGRYWRLWADSDNFVGYIASLSDGLVLFCKVLIVIIPFVLLLFLLVKRFFSRRNNDYDKDSRALRMWKRFSARVCRPVVGWFVSFGAFIKARKAYWVTWLVLWLFHFNVITVVLEGLAFYFYFVVSFDVQNIYRQVYKLLLDLSVPFRFIPLWAWLIFAAWLFDRFRKKIAYARLNHMERRNRGFINARPIVYMVCGTMGKKKTTAITDMALSQEVMFRDKAFEKLLENDLKFPFFPWCNLENALKQAMKDHDVYNLATVRLFIRKQAEYWESERSDRSRIFDYDYERYGLEYDDNLKTSDIWEVLETYAQLYFIYIIQSSLIISNYSVRVDNVLSDLGNFPLWDADFFKRDSRLMESYSRHAHILDFDSLRLGRKVVEDNRNANNFEFGVVLITEVGKERGNALELSEKKKNVTETNQKNDNFNGWLKMVRHSATVDNFSFVRVIADEQRPESWGADARDLCEIVHIRESRETRLAMPFFSLAELLYSWVFGRFAGLYYQYRYVRADNTLLMYFLKWATAKVTHYYSGIYNRFGYSSLRVQVENGTQDGQVSENEYFLMSKKIYSNRFTTDCFSDFFAEKALRSPVGLDDLGEYATEKASFEELAEQNSYFINDLLSGLK